MTFEHYSHSEALSIIRSFLMLETAFPGCFEDCATYNAPHNIVRHVYRLPTYDHSVKFVRLLTRQHITHQDVLLSSGTRFAPPTMNVHNPVRVELDYSPQPFVVSWFSHVIYSLDTRDRKQMAHKYLDALKERVSKW